MRKSPMICTSKKIKGLSRPTFIEIAKKKGNMKDKIINTHAKMSDGSTVSVASMIKVPSTLEELKTLAAEALENADESAIESHLTDLFVSWCVAHTYQSQVRSKLKTASPKITSEQLNEIVNSVPFRIPRPASAMRGDKVTIKRSNLTPDQIATLKNMGIL